MKTKTCAVCGKDFPLDEKHFRHRVQNGKQHFAAECRQCQADAQKARAARKEIKKRQALHKIETAGVDVFLASVSQGGSNIPHTAEVVERVMQYFGGVAGFSSIMVKQYWDSQPGGSQRNKLLETMCRMVQKNVETGGAKKPLQLWSEDELEQELEKRLNDAVAEFNGVTINVTKEEAPPRITATASPVEQPDDGVSAGGIEGTTGGDTGSSSRSVEVIQAKRKPKKDT
jgi:hypothetical protein